MYVQKLGNKSEIEDNGAHVVESRYRDRLGEGGRRELQVGKIGRTLQNKAQGCVYENVL